MAAKTNTSAASAAQVDNLVRIVGNQPTTTTLIVSEGVGMEHAGVIKLVRKFKSDFEEFGFLRFQIQEKRGTQGAQTEFAELNEDQATYLMTLFRNTEIVRAFKIKLVKAFRKAINEIAHLRTLHASPDRHQARIEGKAARHLETAAIKTFVEYAANQGSGSPEKYYQALSKAVNSALFLVHGAVGKNFRDGLSAVQLAALAMAETIVERALVEAMAAKMFYKDAYRLAANRVKQFAGLVGQTVPGHSTTMLPGAQ